MFCVEFPQEGMKNIRKGADIITFHDAIPEQAPVEGGGFLPFGDEIDNDLGLELEDGEREEHYYDVSIY